MAATPERVNRWFALGVAEPTQLLPFPTILVYMFSWLYRYIATPQSAEYIRGIGLVFYKGKPP